MRAQAGDDVGVVLFALAAAGNEDLCVKAHLARFGEARCVGDVRDDNGDF